MSLASRRGALAIAAAAVCATAACTGGSGGTSTSSGAPSGGNIATVARAEVTAGSATKDVPSIVWYGGYRPPITLDPIKLADYPEETAIPNMCQPMITVSPDYALSAGLVTKWAYSDSTHLVLTVRGGVTFWDGKPMTAQDVAYSIERNIAPKYESNYASSFGDATGVSVAGPRTVVIAVRDRSVVLTDALASLGGAVVEEAFAERAGQSFGSPRTGVMCTGPYKFTSFDGSSKLVMTRNDNYWNRAHRAHAKTFTFVYPTDPAAIVNGMKSGSIDGGFTLPPSLVAELKTAKTGRIYLGGPGSTPINADLLFTKSSGTGADVQVRQALSLALDRAGIARTVYFGTADPLYKVSGPGTWGYAKSAFHGSYPKIPFDAAKAASLVKQAGATGKTLVFGYPAGDPASASLATVVQQEAAAAGLTIELQAVPSQQYGSLFADAKARKPYDFILTLNYTELPEPLLMDRFAAAPGASTNFSDYDNALVNTAFTAADRTTDDTARAKLLIGAETQMSKDLPSIPIVQPRAIVFQNSRLAGATLTFSYMTSPWAAAIGGK